MSVVQRTYNWIERGRNKELIQCIPTKLAKYDEYLDGVTQRIMILIGAETSVGKTTFIRDKFVHGVYEEYVRVNDPSKLDVVFVDFSLEMAPEINMAGAMSRRLWLDHNKIVPAKRILKNLEDEPNTLLQGMKPYFTEFNKKLITLEEEVTPSKYHDFLMDVAKRFGKFEKEGKFISECQGYVSNNPNLYVIIILDTINLAEVDSGHETVKSTIDRISRISVWFRNKCGFTPVIIQQFNAEISAVDRARYGIKTPLLRDFEDSKRAVKDADVVLGLYDPSRHMKDDEVMFKGYNIDMLRSWFRSLHVLKNRYGENNKVIPLKFNGAVGIFSQLPEAKDMNEHEYRIATQF